MKKRYLISALSVALVSTLLLGGCKVEQPNVSTEYDPTVTTLPGGETVPQKTGSSDPEDTKPVRKMYTFTQNETSLFVYRDGKIESLETDDHFDKEYYSKDEFQSEMVAPVIDDYNKEHGSQSVALSALTLQNTTLELKIAYQTTKDYLTFNKSFNEFFADWNVFTVCKVSDLAANDIDITGAFTDMDGNAISSSKIKEICQDYYVCAVNFGGTLPSGVSGKFFMEGDIYYLSSGLTVDSDNAVTLSGTEGIQYIIFY